ncbi:hypothetical protein H9Q69_006710 [Fusarium xylarioides]|uniref:Uncharacterized protein n=1 Tax=Fusarium xylarioides TaxID=221167 RepID=A0A9P7IGP3_9HYPO|nr:hypothetical protein H9Q72_013389 [Fusarium xylarioides]KAG5794249.1 hypothetical protein H9Q69_006710 [Fusarium xylarioides]KAG5806365.1 hypothetical protein H9Q71_009049 [Fusarium xylarioides]KAG5820091.1 hypothetical protein H9Q74_009099 [Fusarium xylarioides]
MKGSWVLENAKATKTKTDNKTSLSGSGTDWDSFMKPSDVNPYWDKIIPADKLAKINAEEEKNQHEAYITKVAAEAHQKVNMATLHLDPMDPSRPTAVQTHCLIADFGAPITQFHKITLPDRRLMKIAS